jgi:hypothetical protein
VIVTHGPTSAIAAISHPRFSPRQTATVETSRGAPASGAAPGGTAGVTRDRTSEVVISAHLPRRGLVVLDDANAPGWSVTVDGHTERALNADVVMRGVSVPAGDHVIRWRYRVPGLRPGAVISLVTLLGLLTVATVAWRRRRRDTTPDSSRRRRASGARGPA